jgi:hypothetical protein
MVLARPAPRAFSTTPLRADKEGTVQNIDKEMRNRERMLASMPRGIDITSHFESIILGTLRIGAAPFRSMRGSVPPQLWVREFRWIGETCPPPQSTPHR